MSETTIDELIPGAWSIATSEPGLLRSRRAEHFAAEVHERTSLTFGEQYRDAVAPNLEYEAPKDPQAWANRVIELPTDTGVNEYQALTGIRYRGQNLERPFVDVVATNIPCDAHSITRLTRLVLSEYAQFRPVCARFFVPGSTDHLLSELRKTTGAQGSAFDVHLVSGALKTLLERPAPKNVARVQLAPISSGEAAALCTRIYADIAEVKPGLPEWATPQDAQSLADAASDGLLRQVLVDETQAGVLAFAARGEQGVHGYSVEEICLDAPFLGQKLANAVLWHGMNSISHSTAINQGSALWGTIHPHNAPSLRNALGVGRTIVGSYVWVGERAF